MLTFCSHESRRSQLSLTCPDAFGKVMASLEDTRGGRACERPCSWRPLSTPAELPLPRHCCHSIRDGPTGPHSTTHPLCSSVSTAPELTGPLCFYRDIHGRFPIDGSVFCTLHNDHTLAGSSGTVTLRPMLTTQAWLSRYSMVSTSFRLCEDPSVSCRRVILRDVGDIF